MAAWTRLLFCIMFITGLWATQVQAQLAPLYPLTTTTGAFSSISGTGTAVAVAGDDIGVNITGLSPGFVVNGVTYTNARMCSNGWLMLYVTTAPTAFYPQKKTPYSILSIGYLLYLIRK